MPRPRFLAAALLVSACAGAANLLPQPALAQARSCDRACLTGVPDAHLDAERSSTGGKIVVYVLDIFERSGAIKIAQFVAVLTIVPYKMDLAW